MQKYESLGGVDFATSLEPLWRLRKGDVGSKTTLSGGALLETSRSLKGHLGTGNQPSGQAYEALLEICDHFRM